MTPYYEEAGIQIFHGDCRAVLPGLGIVDHVITDPPYARDVYLRMKGHNSASFDSTYKGASAARMAVTSRPNPGGSTMPRLEKLAAGEIGCIDDALAPVAAEIGRIVQRWAVVFSDAETTWRWRDELQQAGMRYIRTGAWVKTDYMPQFSGDRPAVGFEPCTIAHADRPTRWNGGGRAAVWTHGTCKTNRPDHPCPKPEPLMHELIELFTDPGDLVLDPFMGSGTTLLACKRLARRAIGIELNEAYCEIAANRLRQAVLPLTPAPLPTQADLLGGDAA